MSTQANLVQYVSVSRGTFFPPGYACQSIKKGDAITVRIPDVPSITVRGNTAFFT